jgi:hypothetical protein
VWESSAACLEKLHGSQLQLHQEQQATLARELSAFESAAAREEEELAGLRRELEAEARGVEAEEGRLREVVRAAVGEEAHGRHERLSERDCELQVRRGGGG